MGILDGLKDRVQDKLDDRRERVEQWADERYQERKSGIEKWGKEEREKIYDKEYNSKKISPEIADKQRKRVEEREQKKLERVEKKRQSEEKPVETRVIETGKKIVSHLEDKRTDEEKEADRKERLKRRKDAALAYRRENRAYNSEARRMRSQVTPLSSFSAGLLGVGAPPVRSKYPGTQETGMIDPLSNWSSGIMGAGKVRQDSTMEGIASRMAGRQNPGRKPKLKSNADPLVGFNNMIMGRR
jgi:hypothetical protein